MVARPRRQPLTEELVEAIESLVGDWSRAETEVEPFMSPPQLRLLKILGTVDSMSVGVAAERMESLSSSVTRLCNRLESGGLIRRSTGADDRREVLLSLTTDGRQFLERLAERRAAYINAALSRMSNAALKSLRDGLLAYEKAANSDGRPMKFPTPLMLLRP